MARAAAILLPGIRLPGIRLPGIRLPGTLLPAILLPAFAFSGCALPAPPERTEEEKALMAVLQSDAPAFEVAKACQRLAIVGTKDAVPALAALLDHPEFSHYARIGLEPIPDEAAGEALRKALDRLDGERLDGVINSIGARRDAKAVGPLAALLAAVRSGPAAAAALGRIGTPEAAAALRRVLREGPAEIRTEVADAALRCADGLRAAGLPAEAAGLCEAVRSAGVLDRLRLEAIRGEVLARGPDGLPLLVRTLEAEEHVEFSTALGIAREIPGTDATRALAASLEKLRPERRALLLGAIADRGDRSALPAILEATRDERTGVRRAAAVALGTLGDPSAAPDLLRIAAEDEDVAPDAIESLGRLPGREVDASVLAGLEDPGGRRFLAALRAAGRRRIAAALPVLRKAAAGTDAKVRLVAIEAIGETMDGSDVRFLAERLAASPAEPETKALIAAFGAAARRAPDRDGWAAVVVAAGKAAGPVAAGRFLEALRAIGGPAAAGAVAARARDSDPAVRSEAIAVLGKWPDEAGPRSLIDLAKASVDADDRFAALRGWCDRVRSLRFSKEDRLALCREGLQVARDAEERKVAIFACRGIPAAETMEMLFPLLADPAVADAACVALVGMSQRVIRFQPEMVVRGMRLVLETTKDEELRKIASGLLRNAGGSP